MTLINKIKDKTAKIAVVGLGYVGLPLVIEFCRAGFDVTGFDVDESKISMLRQGKSYIKHIDPSHLTPYSSHFTPTNDFSHLSHDEHIGDMNRKSASAEAVRVPGNTDGSNTTVQLKHRLHFGSGTSFTLFSYE
jgi:hypothetical protein